MADESQSRSDEQPLVRLRRLLGEQWSPQWVPNDAIARACDEIERLRSTTVSERLALSDDMQKVCEALIGCWVTSRDDDGLNGCEHCSIKFDIAETSWPKVIHNEGCPVRIAQAALPAERSD